MADVREFKGAIREAVRLERHADERWYWKVRAINKSTAKIGWGYIDWLNGNASENFTVEVSDDDGTVAVIGRIPNGKRVYAFVGDKHWDDAATIEDGIAIVIHEMAREAHNTY